MYQQKGLQQTALRLDSKVINEAKHRLRGFARFCSICFLLRHNNSSRTHHPPNLCPFADFEQKVHLQSRQACSSHNWTNLHLFDYLSNQIRKTNRETVTLSHRRSGFAGVTQLAK